MENQSSRKIRALRLDNGGEYISGEFNDFCRKAGIKSELTVPYNPQQNGVAERKNKTICEAAGTAVYVQNKCHHAILDQKTLE